MKKHSSFSQDTTQKAATISGIAEGAGTDLNQPLPEPVPPTVQQSDKVEAGSAALCFQIHGPENRTRKEQEQTQRTEAWSSLQRRSAAGRITVQIPFVARRIASVLAAAGDDGIR